MADSFSISVGIQRINGGFDKDKSHSEFLSHPKSGYKNRLEHEEPESEKYTLQKPASQQIAKTCSYAAKTCQVSHSFDRTRYET